jgi:DHA3 family macrolide efflux protein-like MFS transporter
VTDERLLNRNFLLLLQARSVSNLGQQASHIAIIYWVMQATGSATQMGVVAMLGSIPALLAAPIGGFLADRYSRKWIMIGNDLFRAVILVVLPFLLWSEVDVTWIMIYVYLATFAMAASGSIFMPAVGAILPQLVPKQTLTRANSLTQGSSALTSLLGQGLGGVLFRVLGPALLFLMDAFTYLLSAISILFIGEPARATREVPVERTIADAFVRDTKEGIGYCWQQVGLRKILLAALVVNFFAAPTIVLLPLLVDRTYGLAADWYGYFVALMVLGNIAGMLLTGTLNLTRKKRWAWATGGFTVGGIAFLAIGFAPPLPVTAGLFFTLGAGTSVLNVLLISKVQASVAADILGRVMAALNVLSIGVVPIAMLVAGTITDALHQNVLPIFLASGVVSLVFSAWLANDRDIREYLSTEPAGPPTFRDQGT